MARIKFAIEPDALQGDSPTTPQETDFLRLRIELLLSFWQSFGTLVDPDPVYMKLFDQRLTWDRDSVRMMKSALNTFINGGARSSADLIQKLEDEEGEFHIDWEAIVDSGSMAIYLTDFDLALVGQRLANDLGLGNRHCVHCPPGTPEFVDVASWIRGVSLPCQEQELDRIDGKRTIAERQLVTDLWQETFQPIAKRSQEVVIIDRYAAVRSLNYSDRNCGLYRLIDLIDEHSRVRKITVYSAYNVQRRVGETPPTLSELKDSLRSKLGQSNFQNVESVTLYLAANNHFGEEGRDRFIRFDSIACTLGHGLDVFEGESVRVGPLLDCYHNLMTRNMLTIWRSI